MVEPNSGLRFVILGTVSFFFFLHSQMKKKRNESTNSDGSIFFHQRSMVEANSRFYFVIPGTISFFFFVPLPDGRNVQQSTILRKLSIHRSMLEANVTWLHPVILGTIFIPLFPLPDERRKGYQSTNSDQTLRFIEACLRQFQRDSAL